MYVFINKKKSIWSNIIWQFGWKPIWGIWKLLSNIKNDILFWIIIINNNNKCLYIYIYIHYLVLPPKKGKNHRKFSIRLSSVHYRRTIQFMFAVQVEAELIDKLDSLVSEGKGDENYRELFSLL